MYLSVAISVSLLRPDIGKEFYIGKYSKVFDSDFAINVDITAGYSIFHKKELSVLPGIILRHFLGPSLSRGYLIKTTPKRKLVNIEPHLY